MKKDNNVIQFRRFLKRDEPTSKRGYALYNEGLCFYRQDRDELALKKFLQAEKEGYKSSDMFGSMAWIYGSFEDYAKAKYYAKKAISLDKEYGFPYSVYASACYHLDEDEDVLKYALLAIEHDYKVPCVYRQVSEMYNKPPMKNFLKAIEYATKAIEEDPDNSFSHYWKGWIYYSNEEYAQALKHFKKSEELGESSLQLYYELSYCYSMTGNMKKAVEYATKCVFIDKENPKGYYRKGFAYFMENYDKKAKEQFLLAEKYGCIDADMYFRLAYIYGANGDREKNFEYIEKGLKLDKTDYTGYNLKAYAYAYFDKDYKTALKFSRKAKKYMLEPMVDYYMTYCYILGGKHRYKKLLEVVDEALDYFPNNTDLLKTKISTYQFLRKFKLAKDYTEKLLEIDSEDPVNIFYLALSYMNYEKDYDKVIEIIMEIIDLEMEDQGGRFAELSFAYCEKKEYEKSLEWLWKFFGEFEYEVFFFDNLREFRKYYKKLSKVLSSDERIGEIAKLRPEIVSDK